MKEKQVPQGKGIHGTLTSSVERVTRRRWLSIVGRAAGALAGAALLPGAALGQGRPPVLATTTATARAAAPEKAPAAGGKPELVARADTGVTGTAPRETGTTAQAGGARAQEYETVEIATLQALRRDYPFDSAIVDPYNVAKWGALYSVWIDSGTDKGAWDLGVSIETTSEQPRQMLCNIANGRRGLPNAAVLDIQAGYTNGVEKPYFSAAVDKSKEGITTVYVFQTNRPDGEPIRDIWAIKYTVNNSTATLLRKPEVIATGL